MTIDEHKRTCSYCLVTFGSKDKFNNHWQRCPVRIKAGYIK